MVSKFIFRVLFFLLLPGFCSHLCYGRTRPKAAHVLKVSNVYIDRSVKGFPHIAKKADSVFHLISHGRPGQLLLDGEWKSAPQIAFFLLSKVPDFKSRIRHLNIYGCEFGKGEAGIWAVAYLQGALGISAAASDDITGKDGDWELEVGTPFSVLSLPGYGRNLQPCPPGYGTHVSDTFYASASSGGYSGAANGAGGPDGSGISVFYNAAPGDTYQGIFTYLNAFSGGDTLKVTAKYNDNRHDGITFEFSADGVTYTAPSAIINGFPSNNTYSTVKYTVPASLTGQYKYIRVRGVTTNSYLNIDAIQAVIADCNTCNISISPSLSAATVTNICPGQTFDLTGITASNTPAGAELTWHTGTPATDANRIPAAAAAAVTGSRFYAAFHSAANSCYSGVNGSGTTMVPADPDTDCDGVLNSIDIDDDNDGTPDKSEMNCAVLSYLNLTQGLSAGANDMDTWLNTYGVRIRHINTTTAIANTSTFNVYPHGSWTGYNDNDGLIIFSGSGISLSFYNTDGITKEAKDYVAIFSDPAPAGTVRVIARDINGNTILDRTDPDGQEHKVFSSQTGGIPIHELVLYNASSGFDVLSFSLPCQEKDTDNDGIANRLDLDSDGDGCYDKSEAGVPGTPVGTATYADSLTVPYNSAGNTGANGLSNALETAPDNGTLNYNTTYASYALSVSVRACQDSDNDGARNTADIDDDNDGVLNAVESPSCFYTAAEMAVPVFAASEIASGSAIEKIHDGDAATTFVFISTSAAAALGKTIAEVRPVYPQAATGITLNLNTATSPIGALSTSATLTAEGWNGNSWVSLATYTTSPVVSANKQTFAFASNVTPYSKYRLFESGTTGVAINNNAIQEIKLALPPGYVPSVNPKPVCTTDADGDGILNHFDLDSDGDTCPDALEAGVADHPGASASMSPSSGALYTGGIAPGTANAYVGNGASGQYGNNGFFNGIETAENGMYNGSYPYHFAVNSAYAACIDSDGDTINDVADIDDDNDGVLDMVEQNCTNINTADKSGIIITKPSTINYSFDGAQTFSNLLDGADANDYIIYNPTGTLSNAEWFRIELPVMKILLSWEIGHYSGQTLFSSSSTYKVQGSNDGANWTDLTGTLTYANNVPGQSTQSNSNIADFSSNTTAYKFYRYYGISGASGGGWATEFYFSEKDCPDPDTDNDGIPNRLDLDSDGDGCTDTKEAILYTHSHHPTEPGSVRNGSGGMVTATMTMAEAVMSGPYGGNGFADEIQAAADTNKYKSLYTYRFIATSAANNVCADSDNDGIPDFAADMDDDDDGVPNAVESPSCFFTLVQATDITEDVTSDFTWATANPLPNTYDDNIATYGMVTPSVNILGKALITFDLPVITKAILDTVKLQAGATAFGSGTWFLEGLDTLDIWDTLSVSQVMNAANTTYYFVNSLYPNTPYHSYRITGSSNALVTNNARLSEVHISYKRFNPSTHPVKSGCVSDADGDGMSNFLDLDSDGDGCPDAVEAGVSGVLMPGNVYNQGTGTVMTDNAIAAGPYGKNGLADSVESGAESGAVNYTSTYLLYGLVSSLNACRDADGDSVKDISDIDDDNDGVLDAVESPACFYTAAEMAIPAGITSEIPATSSIANLYDNAATPTFAFTATTAANARQKTIFEIAARHPVAATSIILKTNAATTSIFGTYNATNAYIKAQGWNGLAWIDLATYTANPTVAANLQAFTFTNTAVFSKYRLYDDGATGVNITAGVLQEVALGLPAGYNPSANPKPGCVHDTDADGVVNHLDLDSDGDGCPDATEAGVAANSGASGAMSASGGSLYSGGIPAGTPNAYTGNGTPGQYGANGFFNGIEATPPATESGIYNGIYTYQYAEGSNHAACRDTDGDTVNDLADIDDDNDGVLDATESPACFYTAAEMAVPASVTTEMPVGAQPVQHTYDNNTTTTFSFANTTAGNALGKTIFEITPAYPQAATAIALHLATGATPLGTVNGTATIAAQGWNGTGWVTLATYNTAIAVTANTQTFAFSANAASYSRYRLFESGPNGVALNNNAIQEVKLTLAAGYTSSSNPRLTCAADTDHDGVFNHLDLDSDGDKCPDAYEAGTYNKAGVTTGNGNVQNGSEGSVTTTLPTANALIGGPYSGNGFADVLQAAADTNAYKYAYTYVVADDSVQKACCIASATAPVLTMTTDSICGSNAYNLSGVVSGTAPAYNTVAWFSDSTHANAYPTPEAAMPGTYYAFYKDTINNCYSPASTAFTVVSKPVPAGSASPQSICSGSTSAIILNANVSGSTYTWTAATQSGSVSGFSNCTSGCGGSIAQTLTGAGVVRYAVTPAADGCTGNTFTVDVTVSALPPTSIAYSASPYASDAGYANVTQTGQTGGAYSATPPGLSIDTATGQLSLGSSFADTYTVKYVFGNGICTDSATATITIYATNDTATATPDCPDCPVTVCAIADDVDTAGGAVYSSPCGTPAGYTASAISASGCITYTPSGTVTDTAITCILTCHDGKCDTTRIILYPPVPDNDTVTATPPCPTCPVVVCPVFDDVNAANVSSVTTCGVPAGYASSGPDAAHCFTFTPDGTATDTSETCIVVCDGNRCDTTKVVVYPAMQTIHHDWNVGFVNKQLSGDAATNDQVYAATAYSNIQAAANNPAAQLPVLSSDGTYTFTASQAGNYVFTISVCAPMQSAGCPTQLLVINITDTASGTGALPIANLDMVTTSYQTPVGIPTLDNDASGNYGGSLNPASVTVTDMPGNGTIDSIGADGAIYYRPNPGFTGTDTLVYRVCDQLLPTNCNMAYQFIHVLPLNAANTTAASDDYAYTLTGSAVSGSVTVNDIDPEGNMLSVTPATLSSAGGSFVIDEQGSYTFTPAAGFAGAANYSYQVCDNSTPAACANATVYILVYPQNTMPLPVKVIDFSGKAQDGNSNLLTWKVTNAKDMDSYEVMRSTDGKTWASLGRITAKNRTGVQSMQLIDNNPDAEDYYRLLLHGRNGQTDIYPKVVYIRRAMAAAEWAKLYPNPARTVVNLEYYSLAAGAALRIDVMDISGRNITSVEQQLSQGSNVVPINISGMADGVYNIRYTNTANGMRDNIKFIKETK